MLTHLAKIVVLTCEFTYSTKPHILHMTEVFSQRHKENVPKQ
jgi:hypothetical protein